MSSPCIGRSPAAAAASALQGHVDVVPEGAADMWVTPPYEPSIRGGRMYGRGAGDMKAGIVSYLTAFKALQLAGLQPAAEVQMQSVIEEECSGNGALASCWRMPKADAVIIPEPGPGLAALYTAEVGVVWAWVTVSGRPAHVRDMQAGVNAIEAATDHRRRLQGLRARDEPGRAHPPFLPRRQPSGQRQPRYHRGWRVEFLGRQPLPHRPAGRGDDGLHGGADQGGYRADRRAEASSMSGCVARR